MIPQEYRFTLETEPRYHGWENTGWDADGVLHLGSALHPGRLSVDMAGGKVLFRAEDFATADMLADVFDTPPDEAYPCTPDSLKETLTAMAAAMTPAGQAPPETEGGATAILALHGNLHLRLTPDARHLPYLHYHRQHIFIP